MQSLGDITKGVQRFVFILTDEYEEKTTALSAYLASYLDQKKIPFSYLKLSPILSLTFGNLSPEKEGEAFITWDGGEVDYDVGIIERSITGELPRTSCLTLGQAIQHLYVWQAKQRETGFSRLTFEDDLLDYLVEYVQTEPPLQHAPPPDSTSYDIPIRIIEIGGGVRKPSTQIFTKTIEKLLSLSSSECSLPSVPQRGSVIILMASADPDSIKPDIMQLFCGYAPDYIIHSKNLSSTDILDDEYIITATRVDDQGTSDETIMLKELISKWNKSWAFKAFVAKNTTELVNSMAELPVYSVEEDVDLDKDIHKTVELAKHAGKIDMLGNVLAEMKVEREEVVELGADVLKEFDNAMTQINEENNMEEEDIFNAICMVCGTAKGAGVCPVCSIDAQNVNVKEAIAEATTLAYLTSPTVPAAAVYPQLNNNTVSMMMAASEAGDVEVSTELPGHIPDCESESESDFSESPTLHAKRRYLGSVSVAKMVQNYGDAFLADKDVKMPLGSLITVATKDTQDNHTPSYNAEAANPVEIDPDTGAVTNEVPGELMLLHYDAKCASKASTKVMPSPALSGSCTSTNGHLKLRIENMRQKKIEQSQRRMLADAAYAKTLKTTMSRQSLDIPFIIAIVGKFVAREDSYLSILEALRATMRKYHYDKSFAFLWVDPTALTRENCDDILKEAHSFVLPGGFGDIGIEGLMLTIKYARTHKKPILGLCLGFQMMVCEFARNVCGLSQANSTEMDPDTPHKLIVPISEMLKSGQIRPLHKQNNIANPGTTEKYSTMRLGDLLVSVKPDTILSECYQKYPQVKERHWHSFAFNTLYIETLTKHGLIISGTDFTNQLPMAIELSPTVHPFFMATQYHPEFTSKHRHPHAIFVAFISAIFRVYGM